MVGFTHRPPFNNHGTGHQYLLCVTRNLWLISTTRLSTFGQFPPHASLVTVAFLHVPAAATFGRIPL
jgi:hypothetical protein